MEVSGQFQALCATLPWGKTPQQAQYSREQHTGRAKRPIRRFGLSAIEVNNAV